MGGASAHTAVFPVQPWERRPWRRDAGCQSVHSRDVRHRGHRAAAEISMEVRQDAVDLLVSVDRWAEFGPAPLLGAFLAERPDDSDMEQIAPDAREIFDPLAEYLPVLAHRWFPSANPPDSQPLGAALEERQVLEPSLKELLPASLRSDVQPLDPAPTELQRGATERRSETQLRVPPVPLERAKEHPELQVLHAEARLLALPVSPAPQLKREPVARSSLLPLQPSPLPLLIPLLPDRGNISALARRARYQSSSSASSFP
jgi:hypothetical protein